MDHGDKKRMKKRMGMMVAQPENPTLPTGGPTPKKPKPKAPPAMIVTGKHLYSPFF